MRPLLAGLAGVLLAASASAANPVIRFTTPLGSWDVELCAELSAVCLGAAPNTVANFLGYVDSGAYAGSFIHRSVPFPSPFAVQGGSYNVLGGVVGFVPTGPPVTNEFNQSNVRGTLAVPLAGTSTCDTQKDSGTSGWFINQADNGFLDCGLFTVFGVVLGSGMDVVDMVSGLLHLSIGLTSGPYEGTPVTDAFVCDPDPDTGVCRTDWVPYLIYTQITRVPEPGATAGGAAALAALAGLALGARPGSRPR